MADVLWFIFGVFAGICAVVVAAACVVSGSVRSYEEDEWDAKSRKP